MTTNDCHASRGREIDRRGLVATANAWAGEFYEKAGAAIKGHDPVAYFKDRKPVKGSMERGHPRFRSR